MCNLIKVENLFFSYKDKNIFSDFNLTINKGDILAVLGHNGAGKTTLFKLIAGLLKSNGGKILKDIDSSKIGYMNENLGLYQFLTGYENIDISCQRDNIMYDIEKIDDLLSDFGLNSYKNKYVRDYSTGMKRKLSLLSIMLSKPELFLLDEPFTGIDPISLNLMITKLKEESNKDNAIVFINHELESTKRLCNKFLIIRDGILTFYSDKKEDIQNLNEIYIKYS